MENHYKNIRTLIQNAKEKIGKPVSIQVVAATIESLGIRDKDIKHDYGFANIRELAALVFAELIAENEISELKNAKEIELAEKEPVKNEISTRRIKMMITEAQFKNLAQNVLHLQEQKEIVNTYLVKRIKASK